MPKRKKGHLPRYSIAAKRKQAARNAETDVEKEERRAANAARQRASRGAERLTADRSRRHDFDAALSDVNGAQSTDTTSIPVHDCGTLHVECQHCKGQFFLSERLARSSARDPKFGLCYGHRRRLLILSRPTGAQLKAS